MEYDESGSEDSSQTQPDESADIEEALAGGEIQEPEDGWEDVDEDMDGEDDEDDEDDEDLHDDEGNENEIMWEGGMNNEGGGGLLADDADDDDEAGEGGLVDGDDTGDEDIDMFSAADE